jgi:hypothetical protein
VCPVTAAAGADACLCSACHHYYHSRVCPGSSTLAMQGRVAMTHRHHHHRPCCCCLCCWCCCDAIGLPLGPVAGNVGWCGIESRSAVISGKNDDEHQHTAIVTQYNTHPPLAHHTHYTTLHLRTACGCVCLGSSLGAGPPMLPRTSPPRLTDCLLPPPLGAVRPRRRSLALKPSLGALRASPRYPPPPPLKLLPPPRRSLKPPPPPRLSWPPLLPKLLLLYPPLSKPPPPPLLS